MDLENIEEYRNKLRHSAAHLLAEAVLKIHPEAKLTIGPPIKDGFYYDFDVDVTFSSQDLASIERDMKRSVKRNTKFEGKELTKDEATADKIASKSTNVNVIVYIIFRELRLYARV